MKQRFLWTTLAAVVATLVPITLSAQREPSLEYAVKLVCGRADRPAVAWPNRANRCRADRNRIRNAARRSRRGLLCRADRSAVRPEDFLVDGRPQIAFVGRSNVGKSTLLNRLVAQALLSAVPIPDPKETRARQRIILSGDPPSPIDPPQGCRFHPRCPIATGECSQLEPEWREIKPDHWVACHKVEH